MKTTDVVIAANTIWVASNGGTHGSPVRPLLHRKATPSTRWLLPGKARLRRRLVAIQGANG
jgi:hypothetical protein